MHSFLRFGAIQWHAHGFTIRIIPWHVLIDFTSLSYIQLDARRNCNFQSNIQYTWYEVWESITHYCKMLWRLASRNTSHIGYQIRLRSIATMSPKTHESLTIVSTPSKSYGSVGCIESCIKCCRRCSSGYWAVFPRHSIRKLALLFRMYPSRPIYHENRVWGRRSANWASFEKPKSSGRGWWFRVGESGQDNCTPPPKKKLFFLGLILKCILCVGFLEIHERFYDGQWNICEILRKSRSCSVGSWGCSSTKRCAYRDWVHCKVCGLSWESFLFLNVVFSWRWTCWSTKGRSCKTDRRIRLLNVFFILSNSMPSLYFQP